MKFATLAGALAAAVLLHAPLAMAQDGGWGRTWGASPQAPTPAMGPIPASPGFKDQTLRQVVRVSGGGSKVRIRFSNEYGAKPVAVGAASIALPAAGGGIVPGSARALTFGGKPAAVMRPNSPLLSDPVDLEVAPLSSLTVSLYLSGAAEACTCHGTAIQTGWVAAGDQTAAPALTGAAPLNVRAFLSAVEVSGNGSGRTIVALGDSITDGVGATVDANRRWPDVLAERLAARGGRTLNVSNQGISGNRVLNHGFGEAALARFDRDVLSTPGLAYVIVFEGINDIGISFMPRVEGPFAEFMKTFAGDPIGADDLIAGYRQLIDRAHARGVKIYGATIAPYEGAGTYSPEGERVRQAVNAWIRTGGAFDGVIDFDAAVRDPARPSRMREGTHMGDWLHGSDAGYRAMAEAIDLKLFD